MKPTKISRGETRASAAASRIFSPSTDHSQATPAVTTGACEGETFPATRLLTVDQTAQILQVNARTIRRWIAARRLSVVRLGRAVRIRPSDLQHIVEAGALAAAEYRSGTT